MSPKVLHVCGVDKFIPPFIDFIEENFGLDDHFFWLKGAHEQYAVEQNRSVYKAMDSVLGQVEGYLKLIRLLNNADKIILHNLFNIRVILILFFMPWNLKKCYWLIWGADLYYFKFGVESNRFKFKEFFRRKVIRKVGHLVTYIPGDVELARKWYGARGQYHECLMYLSNIVDLNIIKAASDETEICEGLNILVGNSADPSNNHIESLEMLLPYKNDDVKIFVPLSYGDPKHARFVIEKGIEWFGDKFIPITSFVAVDDYVRFLKSIDIAIFNHKRQQAMGNTITLLAMGKTVYMRSDVSQWQFLNGLGIRLKDISNLENQLLADDFRRSNTRIIQSYFSKENLIKQYSLIF